MQLVFWSFGKQHETYVKEGIDLFTNRLKNYYSVQWELMPLIKNAASLTIEELKRREGDLFLQKISKDDFLIALDERGKQLSSEGLAQVIQTRANTSTKKIHFLIGGVYGLSTSVLARANYIWSLSELVFPHQLVRLILAEQVYRACTILRNEKYHHA